MTLLCYASSCNHTVLELWGGGVNLYQIYRWLFWVGYSEAFFLDAVPPAPVHIPNKHMLFFRGRCVYKTHLCRQWKLPKGLNIVVWQAWQTDSYLPGTTWFDSLVVGTLPYWESLVLFWRESPGAFLSPPIVTLQIQNIWNPFLPLPLPPALLLSSDFLSLSLSFFS